MVKDTFANVRASVFSKEFQASTLNGKIWGEWLEWGEDIF